MTTITIALSEEHAKNLQELASRLHIAPEELVRVSVEELLARPDEQFQQALNRVLKKNAELYRRLSFVD
jgi:antitoxin FitA